MRSRLGDATVIIVDPSAYLRKQTFQSSRGGRSVPVLSAQVYGNPELRLLRQKHLDPMMARAVIVSSGAESIHGLLTSPVINDFDTLSDQDDDRQIAELDPIEVAERTKSLRKTSLIALQSTALVAHEYEEAYHDDMAVRLQPYRYINPAALNYERLKVIAQRSVVFDRGHETETKVVEQLHEAANRRLGRNSLSFVLGDFLESHPPTVVGQVRTGVSQEEVELRIADVAAGFASDVLQERGTLELVSTFAVVIYSGNRLTPERAKRLEDERRFHKRIIARA